MPGIAGREGAVSGKGYARDLGVAEVDRTSSPPALGGQRGRPLRSGPVEVEYAAFEVFKEHPGERLLNRLSARAGRQERNTEVSLEHGDCGDPNRLGGLTVKPRCDLALRTGTHQRGEHIGVEDDQANFAGRAT